VRPVVTPGQTVKPGELLGDSHDGTGRVHSPVAGTVAGLAAVDTPHRRRVPAVEIRTEPDEQTEPVGTPRPDPDERPTLAVLLRATAELGVDVPDADALRRAPRVRRILLNGLDADPLQTVCRRTLMDYADEVIAAAGLLHEVFGSARTDLVVDGGRRGLVATLTAAARGGPVRVLGVPNRYPQSRSVLLVRTITGIEVAADRRPLDGGIWVCDIGTALDTRRAWLEGRAATWRTATITGDAVAAPGNYRFAVGSTIRDVIDPIGLLESPRRIVVGGLLNGVAVPTADTVLTKRTWCVTADSRVRPVRLAAAACIRCGECLEVCPVRLDPRALLEAAERNRPDLSARLHPHACLDCGLCDYVCPSSLPLMRGVHWCREHVPVG
jgi:electron transport complex protein RnfC